MIVRASFFSRNGWLDNLPRLIVLSALCVLAYIIEPMLMIDLDVFSLGSVGLVATVVGIFLSFRAGEAYDRWWEARKLWGRVVNDSRSMARQAITLIPGRLSQTPGDEGVLAAKEIVYRHIAWVYALRTHLRFGGQFNHSAWTELAQFIEPDELAVLREAPNVPATLLMTQGRQLAAWTAPDFTEHQVLLAMDATLNNLYDIQGGCERIKNTVFPATVTVWTRVFVWGLAAILPFAAMSLPGVFNWAEAIFAVASGFMFVKVEQLSGHMKNPFEGRPNDTPMSALARVIERDLRSFVGEASTELPTPCPPTQGFLL